MLILILTEARIISESNSSVLLWRKFQLCICIEQKEKSFAMQFFFTIKCWALSQLLGNWAE